MYGCFIRAKDEIEKTLKQGAIYKFSDNQLKGSSLPHYFIVLNNDPSADELIGMVVTASYSERKHNWLTSKFEEETIFVFGPEQYKELRHKSYIDCNRLFLKTREELIKKRSKGELNIKPEISDEVLQQIKEAALKSEHIPPAQKRIIDPDYKES